MGYSCPDPLGGPTLEWESIFLCPLKALMEITVLWVFLPPCTWINLLSLLLLLLLVLMQLIILSFPRENAEGLWSWWFEVPDHVNRLLYVSLGTLSSRSWGLGSVCSLTQGVEGKSICLLLFCVRSSGLEDVHLAGPCWVHNTAIPSTTLKRKKHLGGCLSYDLYPEQVIQW